MRKYNTARAIFGILEVIAWITVIGGFVMALAGATAATDFVGNSAGLMGAIPGFSLAFCGIIAVATVQFYRASVDTAEMTGKMLQLSKEQLLLIKNTQMGIVAATPTGASPTSTDTAEPIGTPADVTQMKAADRTSNALSADANAEAAPDASYRYQVEHRGETIVLERGKATWGGHSFDTVDGAKKYLESVKASGRTEPVVTVPGERPGLTAKRAIPRGLS